MRFLFRNDTAFNKLKVIQKKGFIVSDTWMCLERGEGEKEIANQGWSRVVKSFSQETGAISQHMLWNGMNGPKLHSKSQVQDAHDSLTQLPFLFFKKCTAGLP